MVSTPIQNSAHNAVDQAAWQSQPLNKAVTLPAEVYFSPDIYRLEQQNIFGKQWCYVGHLSQLDGIGAYFTVELAEQPLVILRNSVGELRGFYNICTHRAGPLVLGEGQCHRLTCLYHAWSFDLEGNLRGIPDMETAENFDRAAHALTPVQVDTWGPFIFVNLDLEAAPLAEQLGELPHLFQRYRLHEWARVHTVDYWLEANWKLHVENTAESYHEPSVHPAIAHLYQQVVAEARHYYYLQRSPLQDEDAHKPYVPGSDLCIDGLTPDQMEWLSIMSFFPNFAWILSPGYALTYLFDPQGPTRTRVRLDWLVPNTEAAKSPENLAPLIQFMENLQHEDMQLLPQIQKRVQALGYHRGQLSPSREMGTHLFQELVMQAIAP
jgi:phenylpropionate dioxygenase-like ring-hydroxylating dioxygenase large terminal subunit